MKSADIAALKLALPGERKFAYGFWRYGEDDIDTALALLELARANGVDHIDTADVYGAPKSFGGAEKVLGLARRRAPSLFAGAVLATKAGIELGTPYNSSRAYLTAACDASLGRLGVERIDLFYIHRPDLMVHPGDLADALDGLMAAGKIANVAVSNFTAAQVEALTAHLKAPLVAHQIEFSPACLDPITDGTADLAMRTGCAVAAWSPLAGGRLGEGAAPAFAKVTQTLDAIGARHGAPRSAVACAFLQQHPAGVTPILGTKTPARLRECLAANALTLTRRDWYDIVEARRGARMP